MLLVGLFVGGNGPFAHSIAASHPTLQLKVIHAQHRRRNNSASASALHQNFAVPAGRQRNLRNRMHALQTQ